MCILTDANQDNDEGMVGITKLKDFWYCPALRGSQRLIPLMPLFRRLQASL